MNDEIKNKIAKRHESNVRILKILTKLVDMYPDLRFGQILSNFVLDVRTTNVNDPFYEESVDTLDRINNNIAKHNT